MTVVPPPSEAELFVYGATTDHAALLAFEIHPFAAENFCDLWRKVRRILAANDRPSDFLVCAIQAQAVRVHWALARSNGKKPRCYCGSEPVGVAVESGGLFTEAILP